MGLSPFMCLSNVEEMALGLPAMFVMLQLKTDNGNRVSMEELIKCDLT